jgi:flavin reductase (DIM6/NTAB) family NADH-FMN oxidoreductase RutF
MSNDSLVKATLQLPCSVVIISAEAESKRGAMTGTAMYVSQSPPLVAVSVSKTFATYRLIEKSGDFVINIVTDKQLQLAKKVGGVHGLDLDKFAQFDIPFEPATKVHSPVISGCFATFECQIKSRLQEGQVNHTIYIAEVVAFAVDDLLRPLVWLNNRYFNVGTECQIQK